MRRSTSVCVLVSVFVGMLQGITARKLKMTPAQDKLLIQEGDELIIRCDGKGEGRLQFSTQWNMAHVKQSEYHITVDNDSRSYTFTRPRTIKEDTGWYACAEEGIDILNDEQTVDHPDTDISSIYVYVNYSQFVTKIWINGTTDTSITIGWSVLPAEHLNLVHYHNVTVTHEDETKEFTFLTGESNYYILGDLETGGRYSMKVAACSNHTKRCGDWSSEENIVVMDRDTKFVPNISLLESTSNSIKISWSIPPAELQGRVHQYKVVATSLQGEKGSFYVNKTENSYVFRNLKPSTGYRLKVSACSEYLTQCGNWSYEEEGFTVLGKRGKILVWFVGLIVFILLIAFVSIWIAIENRSERVPSNIFHPSVFFTL